MGRRFYVDSPIVANEASLVGQEAQHLAKTLRARLGDEVTLFDGSGGEFTARVRHIGRSAVELDVIARHEVERELPFLLSLGVALPKGDRQRWLAEKAVELGVARLTPLRTERGVAQPIARALERLRRVVIEASKQCGRNRLMEVLEPQELRDYVTGAPANAVRWIAHPGASASPGPAESVARGDVDQRPFYLAIGPEGGFTPGEVELAQAACWRNVNLGSRMLRVETAAVALAAVVAIGVAGEVENNRG